MCDNPKKKFNQMRDKCELKHEKKSATCVFMQSGFTARYQTQNRFINVI